MAECEESPAARAMALDCAHLTRVFHGKRAVDDVSLALAPGDIYGLVGRNGAGKSTLLKLIAGYLAPTGGIVAVCGEALRPCQTSARIGCLIEHPAVNPALTGFENVMVRALAQGLPDPKASVAEAMEAVGLREAARDRTKGYSLGMKQRLGLALALIGRPDVLLLDEPTNHLDMESIRWLEGFLMNYKGAVVIVSHDRYFLDRVVTKVVEIFQHQGYVYQGNYTEFAKKKAKIREDLLKQYYNQQREIKHQEEVITKLKSFNREKSIKRAESREKMLDKIERLEKPTDENTDIHIVLEPDVTSGNDVLTVEHLRKAFGTHTLFDDLSFEIKRGERVALIGNNGTGKTTILKIINELLLADGGTIVLGSNVHIGYYDQEHQLLHMEKTIFEEIADDYPQLNHTKIRNVLAAFLFTNDDVFKRIADLSGGERGRVSLAKLMLSDANFLILDEPTNHLDITSKEILESALNQYTGTVFFVSHDRYFINQTATRILDLTGGTIVNYIGNYDYYLEKHDELTRIYVEAESKAQAAQMTEQTVAQDGSGTDKKADWQAQKAEQARIRKLENTLKKAEERIAELEDLIAGIDEECADPTNATNSAKFGELTGRQNEYRSELEKCYEEWEQVSMELES